ncbi:MAG: hypothetical protein Q8P56_04415 [Candidatus Uhrbacteria bacterium]|nr:hypothetical protein [Candidatus Uhrbacteria bacterium]
MDHYICTGTCGAVSSEPGVCQDKNCPNYGQPFQACGCTDDRHGRSRNEEDYKKIDEEEEL